VDAQPREPLTDRTRLLLGGLLGGILGTSGMIFVGIAAEWAAGVPVRGLLPELELGFVGPLAGAGILGPDFSLAVHYLHGAVLGLLFVGILAVGERLRVAPRIPYGASGLIFGAAVAGIVLVLLEATTRTDLGPALIGLVVLLHLTFGGVAGGTLSRVRAASVSGTAGAPASEVRAP
jgi:hypothetical protein